MKTRAGFVSNSSSSSFVILFPHKPETLEDCMRMLYPMPYDNIAAHHICGFGDEVMHATEAVQHIYRKLLTGMRDDPLPRLGELLESYFWLMADEPFIFPSELLRLGLTEDTVVKLRELSRAVRVAGKQEDAVYYAYLKQMPNESNVYEKIKLKPDYIKACNAEQAAEKALSDACDEAAKDIVSNLNGKFIGIVRFADDGGEGLLEHGNAFDMITHIRVSEH